MFVCWFSVTKTETIKEKVSLLLILIGVDAMSDSSTTLRSITQPYVVTFMNIWSGNIQTFDDGSLSITSWPSSSHDITVAQLVGWRTSSPKVTVWESDRPQGSHVIGRVYFWRWVSAGCCRVTAAWSWSELSANQNESIIMASVDGNTSRRSRTPRAPLLF